MMIKHGCCWLVTTIFSPSVETLSAAQVEQDKFAVMLYDSGLDGGGRIRCVRGLDCVMDMSNSSALLDQFGFVQPSEEGVDCYEAPCYAPYEYGYDTRIC